MRLHSMTNNIPSPVPKSSSSPGSDFIEQYWNTSWTYIKTVVDVVREPVLVLDKNYIVLAANEPFYRIFQVEPRDTEGKTIYDLGNGQWNIPAFKRLLEDILPKNTFFKGFEVTHDFPTIGKKVMILNARQIHSTDDALTKQDSCIILVAIEDVTEIIAIAETLASNTRQMRVNLKLRTDTMEQQLATLQGDLQRLQKKLEKPITKPL